MRTPLLGPRVPSATPRPCRLTRLDGLRGLAAAVVVLHHALLTVPWLDPVYYAPSGAPPERWSLVWWLGYTPLHLVWAGPEAVALFFVLSGFVLTRGVMARPGWRRYYPQRIARLYLPTIAAVGIGYAIASLADRTVPWASYWVIAKHPDPSLAGLVKDVTLVNGASMTIAPLWSLQWEVIFSLTLPLFVLGGLLLGRAWPLTAALLLAVLALDLRDHRALVELPVFALGVLLAARFEALRRRTSTWGARRWLPVLATGLALMLATWLVSPFRDHLHKEWTTPLIALGATLVVATASCWQGTSRLLDASVVAWLGRISFSLYLVHEPVVLAVAVLSPGHELAALVVSLPAALALAAAFHRYVEGPAHRFARRVGGSRAEDAQATDAPVASSALPAAATVGA